MECGKKMPSREIQLETMDNTYYFFKADILKRTLTYSTDKAFAANLVTISARRAFEVIAMNKKGEKPLSLEDGDSVDANQRTADLLEQESLTRFDKKKKNNSGQKKKKKNNGSNQQKEKEMAVNGNNAETQRGESNDENKPARQEAKRSRNKNRRHDGKPRRGDGGKEQKRNAETADKPQGGKDVAAPAE